MKNSNVFGDMILEQLMNTHVAFFGKVVKMNGPDECSVQPLDKIKAYGQAAKSQAVVSKVPILNHVRRMTLVERADHAGHLKVEPLRAGDIVLCVCCDRDIASSRKGGSVVPPVGCHDLSNAVVVGWTGRWPHE